MGCLCYNKHCKNCNERMVKNMATKKKASKKETFKVIQHESVEITMPCGESLTITNHIGATEYNDAEDLDGDVSLTCTDGSFDNLRLACKALPDIIKGLQHFLPKTKEK